MSELGPKVEQNPETAREMAHAEEDYRRTRDLKEALGIESQESIDEGIDQVTESTRDKVARVSSESNIPHQLTQENRYEAGKEITDIVTRNLEANGLSVNENGRVLENAYLDRESANKLSDIMHYAKEAVLHATASKGDTDSPIYRSVAVMDGSRDKIDQTRVKDATLRAFGVSLDELNNGPYEPHGVTEGGWNWAMKRTPTEVPGLFYEESLFTKEGADMIRKADLTTLPDSADVRESFRP